MNEYISKLVKEDKIKIVYEEDLLFNIILSHNNIMYFNYRFLLNITKVFDVINITINDVYNINNNKIKRYLVIYYKNIIDNTFNSINVYNVNSLIYLDYLNKIL